ncbi:hypothetical protein SMSP1_02189 [Sedimentisphaera salicampi]|nr:hypothetical protein SMSP1_02189 [Sedimentisphaera salicampi]
MRGHFHRNSARNVYIDLCTSSLKELTMLKKLILFIGIFAVSFFAVSQASTPWVHWKLDQNSGKAAFDSSGNRREANLYGQTFEDNSSEGIVGSSLLFDGSSESASYHFSSSEFEEYTICFWVKAASLSQKQYCAPLNTYGASSNGFQIDVDGSSPGNYRYISGSGEIIMGSAQKQWVHLAVSGTESETKVYYNGTFAGSKTLSDNIFNQIAIGVNRNGSRFFNGYIDDVQVYDRKLSNSEIHYIYANPGEVVSPEPAVYNIRPEDGEVGFPSGANLTWDTAGCYLFEPKFDIYFGQTAQSLEKIRGSYESKSLDYPLSAGNRYYWRIDIIDDNDSVHQGSLRSFVTFSSSLELLNLGLNSFSQSGELYSTQDSSVLNNEVYIPQAPQLEDGVSGKAFSFTKDNRNELSCSLGQKSFAKGENWSLNMFLKIDSENDSWTRMVGLGTQTQHGLYILEDYKMGFIYDMDYIVKTSSRLVPERWYMLTLIKDGEKIKLYINGRLESDEPYENLKNEDYDFLPYYSQFTQFQGAVDEFKIFAGAITDSKIEQELEILAGNTEISSNFTPDRNILSIFASEWLSELSHDQAIPSGDLNLYSELCCYASDYNWDNRVDILDYSVFAFNKRFLK